MRRLVLGLALAALAAGCGGGGATTRLNAGGSTFVFPIMGKWASEYNKARGVEVNYQSVGSGGGIQQMTSRTFDFGCTDGPMNEEQLAKAREEGGAVVHVPLVMGAVVPAYNLPGVDRPLRFTGEVLADIFLGNIKRWDDKALRDLNPGIDLPDQAVLVVHRSDGSGTTYIWADYLSKVSKEWERKVGVGTSVRWPAGVGQKGNEAVARQVKQNKGALGYIELTYALQSDIAYGLVRNKEGQFVRATLESAAAAAQNALTDIPDDLRYSITDPPGKESYPVCGTVWAVLYLDQPAGKGKEVVDFLRWVTHEGQEYAKGLHYVPLPRGLVERVEKKLDGIKVGG